MREHRYAGLLCAGLCAALLCACGAEQQQEPEPEIIPEEPTIVVSELMSANKAALMDDTGGFPDWIELQNVSGEAVELSALTIFDGENTAKLPQQSLGAGEYALLFCAESGAEQSAALPLKLSSSGGGLEIADGQGKILDSVSFGPAEDDCSLVRGEDGAFSQSEFPTPGFENSDAGYEQAQAARLTPELSINEVLVFNRLYPNTYGEYHDIVELRNNSEEPIALGDYYLSDSRKTADRYRLPEQLLYPGTVYTLELTDQVPFALNSLREQCYLSREDGSITDYVSLHGIPAGGSMGRLPDQNGFFYFEYASVGEDNQVGGRLISAMPTASREGGVFDGVDSVTVELSGPGRIYYSLDGSTPDTWSAEYTGPLSFTRTTALRAVCVEDGKLPSRALTLSFIINEGHSLPVASLVIDPEDFTGWSGIYTNPGEDWERPGNIEFFDGEDSFEIACGVKLHGATSRFAQEKKSYKLNFRDAYGGELQGDVFKNGVTEFSSILLRAAQESSFSTHMRDITMHELAMACDPKLSAQGYRFSVLYINGEYWGIYALREAHSAEHFARHYGYDPDKVLMWQGAWGDKSEIAAIAKFAMYNDMSDADNFHYVAEHMDLDSIATWCIIESFSGNIDINSPNMRFYYSEEDQKLHYALVDLDLGLFIQGPFSLSLETGYAYNILAARLLNNGEFRQLMIEKLSQYLSGPLSRDNAFAVMDRLAAELRPEIARDGAKWGYTLDQWERELQNYLYGVIGGYGRGDYCQQFARSAKDCLGMSSAEYEQYFGDLG